MYPMFNVQRPSPSGNHNNKLDLHHNSRNFTGFVTNLGGAQSAFHIVPGAGQGPNSPPMAAMAIDPASPLAQHAALLTLQAAAVAQAQAVSVASTSPFSLPSSPNGAIGGVLLPLASPRDRLTAQSLTQSQLSPASTNGDRPMKTASVDSVSSIGSGQMGEALSPGQCAICSDRATGKHYGANSCDGCKGFFRRTIRKRQTYVCRFSRECLIDKDKRNTCRYCRFKKCVEAGMKREAVQNERDRISSKRSRREMSADDDTGMDSMDVFPKTASVATSSSVNTVPTATAATNSTLSILLQAENMTSQLRASVITSTNNNPQDSQSGTASSSSTCENSNMNEQQELQQQRLATLHDLSAAIKAQLLLLVEWAKVLPPFFDLPLDDQVALLRAYAAQHLLLGVARRSIPYKDVLLLSNDACIPRTHSSELHDVNHVIVRLLDELVEPLREIQLDDTEYSCVKALLFFNPNAYGLHHKSEVKVTRRRVLEALQAYVTDKPETEDKVRFGNILLLLPPLQAMSQQFIEDLQLATLFGMARFDKLLEELLLAAAEPLSAPFLAEGISAITNKVAGNLIGLVNGSNTDSTENMKHSPESPL